MVASRKSNPNLKYVRLNSECAESVFSLDTRTHDFYDIVKLLTNGLLLEDDIECKKYVESCFVSFYGNAVENFKNSNAKQNCRFCVIKYFLFWILYVACLYDKKIENYKFLKDISFLNIVIKYMMNKFDIIIKNNVDAGDDGWRRCLFLVFDYITDGGVYSDSVTEEESVERFSFVYKLIVDENNKLYDSYGLLLKELINNFSWIYRKVSNNESIISVVDVFDEYWVIDSIQESVRQIVSAVLKN